MLSCFLLLITAITSDEIHVVNSSASDFVPSTIWKVVTPGQAIPSGIHVRHNFQTGITEGKLMDNSTTNHKENQVTLSRYNANTTIDGKKSSKSHKMNISFNSVNQFRSLKEIRKDAEKVNLFAKSDSRIIQELFDKYKGSTEENQKSLILDDLSEYMHQFDNARNFASDGRLGELAKDLITAPFLRKAQIMRCLSSALQGNPPVKLKMLESGLLELIGQQLQNHLLTSDQQNPSFILISLSTLGIFLRQFPPAQSLFLYPQHNLSVFHSSTLLHLLADSPIWVCQSEDCRRLKLRIFNFIGDLLSELNATHGFGTDQMDEDIRVDAIKKLLCHPWCEKFGRFLTENEFNLDHDLLERLIKSGIELTSRCPHYVSSQESEDLQLLSQSLSRLAEKYSNLAKLDDNLDELDYFKTIHDLILLFEKSVFDDDTSRLTVEHTEL